MNNLGTRLLAVYLPSYLPYHALTMQVQKVSQPVFANVKYFNFNKDVSVYNIKVISPANYHIHHYNIASVTLRM